jgi:hypothetical protein
MGIDHEVKFHEIEIQLFQEIKLLIMSLKFLIIDSISWSWHFSWDQNCLIMLFRILISWSFLWLTIDHEIKIQNKALLGNFDLMINFLAASTIMRSKVLMHRWLIIRAKNEPQVQLTKFTLFILNFNLMIVLGTNKLIMRSKFLIILFLNFDLMIKVSTSWSKLSHINEQIWSNEQISFWSHEKVNFDLMKKWILISWNLTSWPWVILIS